MMGRMTQPKDLHRKSAGPTLEKQRTLVQCWANVTVCHYVHRRYFHVSPTVHNKLSVAFNAAVNRVQKCMCGYNVV